MANLTVTVQEAMESEREDQWRAAGVPEADIAFSRLSGMDGRDVRTFREFGLRHSLLIVVRCPKAASRAWHGVLPPKPWAVKQKTGSWGVAVDGKGRLWVSDYDLMSVWRKSGQGFEKLFMSAAGGAASGPWNPQAQHLALELNRQLVSRIQHGCQDDFVSPHNPGVKPSDHFAAFWLGQAVHLASPALCAQYYGRAGLTWPYTADGRFIGKA